MHEALKRVSIPTRDKLTLLGAGGIAYGLFGPSFTLLLALIFIASMMMDFKRHFIPQEERKEEEEETNDDRNT